MRDAIVRRSALVVIAAGILLVMISGAASAQGSDGPAKEWCLPQFLLVPEVCGSPLFIFLLGGEIWLSILLMHAMLPLVVAGFFLSVVAEAVERARLRREEERESDPDDSDVGP